MACYEITTRTVTARESLRIGSPTVEVTLFDVVRDGAVVAEGCRSHEEAEAARAQLEAGDRIGHDEIG